MQRSRIRALVIGAISRDLDASSADPIVGPGGVPYYAGIALARLGARTRVVTRVHPEDAVTLLEPLRAEGIEVRALPSEATTTYRNDYSGPEDVHELCATSDPIRAEDVPEEWIASDLVHLGPLHPEDVHPEVASRVRGFTGLDAQGLLRRRTAEGTRLEASDDLTRFLPHLDVLQVSEAELAALLRGEAVGAFLQRHALRELVITRGRRGLRLLTSSGIQEVAAPPVQRHHPVGAGDVTLASYLLSRASGRGPYEAAQGAVQVAARKIETGDVPKGTRW